MIYNSKFDLKHLYTYLRVHGDSFNSKHEKNVHNY